MIDQYEKHKHGHPLMEVFHFTQKDLERNRVGFLGEAQMERLEKQFQSGAALYGAVYGIACTFAFFALLGFGFEQMAFKDLGIWMGVIVLIVLGLRVGIRKLRQPMQDDLKEGRVRAAEGVVLLDIGDNSLPSLNVGDQSFTLTRQMFLAFKNHEPYRVYYLPYSKTLVSAEWLRDENDV